jgi:hypothetical protein
LTLGINKKILMFVSTPVLEEYETVLSRLRLSTPNFRLKQVPLFADGIAPSTVQFLRRL